MKFDLTTLKTALKNFESVDLGYPKDEHLVLDQENQGLGNAVCDELGLTGSSTLREFYGICDGIQLPDVGNGFFIYSLAEFCSINKMISEPNKIGGKPIVVIGTDGGGGRFVCVSDSDEVLYLAPAEVSSNREYLGTNVEVIADTMGGFIRYLIHEVTTLVD